MIYNIYVSLIKKVEIFHTLYLFYIIKKRFIRIQTLISEASHECNSDNSTLISLLLNWF